jgi:hypothetical protein
MVQPERADAGHITLRVRAWSEGRDAAFTRDLILTRAWLFRELRTDERN